MLAIPLYWPLIAALVSFPVGFLWYSPLLFGNRWMKLKGFTAKEFAKAQAEMGPWYAVSFGLTIFQAFVLSYCLRLLPFQTFVSAAFAAFWLWAGFITITQATNQIFSKDKPNWELYAIDTGYQLVQLTVMALTLAGLRYFGV